MDEYYVKVIDCFGVKCKNIQRLNTIDMYFYVTLDEEVAISYSFHSIDFNIWKKLINIHIEDVLDFKLEDCFGEYVNINEIENDLNYYKFIIKSKDFNLYRNINLIPFLDDNKGWNNMEESIRLNTWKI